jgi:hypothetical protein
MAAAIQNFVITHDGFACDIRLCPLIHQPLLPPIGTVNIFLTMLSPLTFIARAAIRP